MPIPCTPHIRFVCAFSCLPRGATPSLSASPPRGETLAFCPAAVLLHYRPIRHGGILLAFTKHRTRIVRAQKKAESTSMMLSARSVILTAALPVRAGGSKQRGNPHTRTFGTRRRHGGRNVCPRRRNTEPAPAETATEPKQSPIALQKGRPARRRNARRRRRLRDQKDRRPSAAPVQWRRDVHGRDRCRYPASPLCSRTSRRPNEGRPRSPPKSSAPHKVPAKNSFDRAAPFETPSRAAATETRHAGTSCRRGQAARRAIVSAGVYDFTESFCYSIV